MNFLNLCFVLAKNAPEVNRVEREFPYSSRLERSINDDHKKYKMKKFTLPLDRNQTLSSSLLTIKLNDMPKERPIINSLEQNIPPTPTPNPFIGEAVITVTTGIETTVLVTSITSPTTNIETKTTVDGYSETDKFTETFIEIKGTFTLTHSKIKALIPTRVSFETSTDVAFLTTTFTLSEIISLTHTTTIANTSHYTISNISLSKPTISETATLIPSNILFCFTETIISEDTSTTIFTEFSETYIWTNELETPIYTITKPWNSTYTHVSKGEVVSVSSCADPGFRTEEVRITTTNVYYRLTYETTNFPEPTTFPSELKIPDLEGDIITFSYIQTSVSTDSVSLKPTKCKEDTATILATWTLAPTVTMKGNSLATTNVLQKVVTEVGGFKSCFEVKIAETEVLTNVLTATKVKGQAYTETIITTSSVYYLPQKTPARYTYVSNVTEIKQSEFSTVIMTDILTAIGTYEKDMTFVKTFGTSYTRTIYSFYTTILTYSSTSTAAYFTYLPSSSNTTVNTIALTRVFQSEPEISLLARSSICTNYLKGMISISSTVVYTYIDYMTLVSLENTEKYVMILSELGKSTKSDIISVNIIHSTSEKSIDTVTSSAGSTDLSPGSSITNSLLVTKLYTATYIDRKTEVTSFEDQCYKKFTFSNTYMEFPTIIQTKGASVTTVSLNLQELTQTSIPSLYTIYTYGYTIVGGKATRFLGDFVSFTMTNTIVYPSDKTILGTVNTQFDTATGSSINSKTFIDYIPVRSPFQFPQKEDLNPYYTKVTLTFTTAAVLRTYSSVIYQRSTVFTEPTVTNLLTSTKMFTETFFRQDRSYTLGYSAIDVLVPTEASVWSGQNTMFLTYHTIGTTILTVTHTSYLTATIGNTFVSGTYESTKELNISTYKEVKTSLCYSSFKVTQETSAYIFTDIFFTWLWTNHGKADAVTYTITMLKDFTYTGFAANDKRSAFKATYSCVGDTTYYTNTITLSNVTAYTNYSLISYPAPSEIPKPDVIVESPIKTNIITQTYVLSYNTYVSELSSTVCQESINTVTLTYTNTFKHTFAKKDGTYSQMYTETETIAYTPAMFKINQTSCNTHILKQVKTDTQMFTILDVKDARTNSMFKQSITDISIPYNKPKAVMVKTTYSPSTLILTIGATSSAITYTQSDIFTFIEIGSSMTLVETYTSVPFSSLFNGPTTADVFSEVNTNQYSIYTTEISSTVVHSIVYTQKSKEDLPDYYINNPCLRFESNVIETMLKTYIETYSQYALLASFKNNGDKETTVTNLGESKETEVVKAAFFSTTTVVSSSTVVKLGGSQVVQKGSSITNYYTTTFTLTQIYVSSVTMYTQFADICYEYDVVKKETKIPIPIISPNVKTMVLGEKYIQIRTPSDVEYITLLRGVDYREGLTVYNAPDKKVALEGKGIPTRTFSLFDSYTYTSKLFTDTKFSVLIFELVEGEVTTVVEVMSKTHTVIINAPPPSDWSDIPDYNTNNNDNIYIIIGVVVAVLVICIVAVVVFFVVRMNQSYLVFDDDIVAPMTEVDRLNNDPLSGLSDPEIMQEF